ncbi:hypothetical protein T02_14990 [Trichinella nativa]|uniref:Uncharacterized protein n=1 Tax=Trichinella nativa TaxID=6335 RepID=A0A0V1KPW4_9BILA|nr:hypothetical protein T02_14990 [Trichinella nativa]
MERTENHQETVGLEKLKLDDDQLKDYEKQVKSNDEDIEETGQDEQAMLRTILTAESRQGSMIDEEKKAGECVRNINADKVNEGVFEGSPDGNGQSSSRNEAQTDENMDASQNGVLGDEIDCDRQISHICPAFLLLWSMRGTPCFNALLTEFLQIMSDPSLSEECEEP